MKKALLLSILFVLFGCNQQNTPDILPPHVSELISDGSGKSLYKVGAIYEEGDGVAVDLEKAVKWYYEASQKGSIDAHYAIWSLWEDFSGSNLNPPFPMSQFKKSRILAIRGYEAIMPESNNPELYYRLGLLYDPGIGMDDQESQKSKQYLIKAAKMGHKEARDLLEFIQELESLQE
jgi:TPR repeat protein